jgi:hypothetical protein
MSDNIPQPRASTWRERERVWITDGRIITRDSAGTTSGWSDEEAVKLHRDLGRIIDNLRRYGGRAMADGAPVA